MTFHTVVLYILLLHNIHRIYALTQMGPADIIIERVEDCENPEKYSMKLPIQMQKINRTHAGYSACTELPGDLDKTTALNMTVAKWGDGGWKPNALNFFEADVCNVLDKYVKKVWTAIQEGIGMPGAPCPLPKNKYCVEKLVLELEGLFPSMLYGKFRMDAMVLWGDEVKTCVRAYLQSTPPKKGVKV